jgi:hypothetical protein
MTSNIERNLQAKPMTYGHGNAIMVLVGERMGLAPALVAESTRYLEGGTIHPMTGAAIEKEAVALNDRLRSSAALIGKANAQAEELKVQYGFAVRKAPAKAIPGNVKSRVTVWLRLLREEEAALHGVQLARGKRHYLALELAEREPNIRRLLGKLDEFLALAATNGVDGEAFLQTCGGVPDFAQYGFVAKPAEKDHTILENGEQLAVDAATAAHLVADGLIYNQGDDPTAKMYHVVDGHSWREIEAVIAQFNAQSSSGSPN